MADPFRVYAPEECGADGYPLIWHRNDGSLDELILEMMAEGDGGLLAGHGMRAGIKHIVRAQAGHRCLRCNHPFVVGESGVMEGPLGAQAKAFAADIGVNHEVLDQCLLEMKADLTPSFTRDQEEKALDKARRVNWSRCDGKCRHGGPARWRYDADEWLEEGDFEGEVGCRETTGELWSYGPDYRDGLPQNDAGTRIQVEAAWRILTVHHLDEVKANLRWWNLVALCQRCHLLIQRKVTMDQPWPWEHTDWFRPYAAAWYALKYRGEELDRLQTFVRLDELLELGKREESVERMPL